jgi:uncharacterized membrane-anchored protein
MKYTADRASRSTAGSAPPRSDAVQRTGHALRALRVPEITALFWIIKGLSTAMGESTSDYLVHRVHPVPAVLLGFAGFLVALALQFAMRRYVAWTYWFAVVMVGVFGTMAADVLHVGFGVPYFASAALYGLALAAVFATWQASEKTLSIHSVDRPRREVFYWAAVVATFALGTAVGDLTAYTLHLGYFNSILLFAAVITIPAIGYWRFRWNAIFAFWFAYVVTRPLGASVADWMGKPASVGGLGWGQARVSLVLTTMIVCLVAYLAVTRKDVQRDHQSEARTPRESPAAAERSSPRGRPERRVAERSRGLVVRVLVWMLLLLVALSAFFLIGYLVGPHVVSSWL